MISLRVSTLFPSLSQPRIGDLLQSMEAVLQEGGDSEEAMGEDHCHHGPSLVAPSPSNGRYSYLHSSLNKMYLSSICIYSASVSQPVDTESVTAGLEDLQLGQGNNCLAINVSTCSKLYTQLCTHACSCFWWILWRW